MISPQRGIIFFTLETGQGGSPRGKGEPPVANLNILRHDNVTPTRSPAKRVRVGEDEQRSGAYARACEGGVERSL